MWNFGAPGVHISNVSMIHWNILILSIGVGDVQVLVHISIVSLRVVEQQRSENMGCHYSIRSIYIYIYIDVCRYVCNVQ